MNSDSLTPANPDVLDGVDDLMQLSYLNEPSVLYNLQYRYDRDLIYVSKSTHLHINFKILLLTLVVYLIMLWSCTYLFPDESRSGFGCH